MACTFDHSASKTLFAPRPFCGAVTSRPVDSTVSKCARRCKRACSNRLGVTLSAAGRKHHAPSHACRSREANTQRGDLSSFGPKLSWPHDAKSARGLAGHRSQGMESTFRKRRSPPVSSRGRGPERRYRNPHRRGCPHARLYPGQDGRGLFQFRHKIGIDVVLEALRETWRERRATMKELEHHVRVDRVAKVMRPYLESLT